MRVIYTVMILLIIAPDLHPLKTVLVALLLFAVSLETTGGNTRGKNNHGVN